MNASHLVTYRRYVVHCDLMLRDCAQLAPGLTRFQTDRASACQSWSTGSGLRLVVSSRGAPGKREVVKTLALRNVASAMMHVQRQRRAKYGNKAIGIISAGALS